VPDQARSGGRGVLGDEDTAAALLERKVDTLVLTRNFLSDRPDRSDHMVDTAFEQRADVEEISGSGAERLDEEAGGVGALLRW
jgi:peptide subunit release factor 1 (eRF1)